jgi:hypothetical protein
MKFDVVKDHGHAYTLYFNCYLFDEAFKYGNGAKFRGYVKTNKEPFCVE